MTHSTSENSGNSTAEKYIRLNKNNVAVVRVWRGAVVIDLSSEWKLNFVHRGEKKSVDNEGPRFKSEEQMGRAWRQLSGAHEQVLVKMAEVEVIESFQMSSLNRTETLWQEPKWEDYKWKPAKVRVLKQVFVVYTENSTIVEWVTWFNTWQPVE